MERADLAEVADEPTTPPQLGRRLEGEEVPAGAAIAQQGGGDANRQVDGLGAGPAPADPPGQVVDPVGDRRDEPRRARPGQTAIGDGEGGEGVGCRALEGADAVDRRNASCHPEGAR